MGADQKKARGSFLVPPRLMAHLQRWERIYGGTYVVEHARRPGEPVDEIDRSITAAAKRAGITKRVTPHTLKHTAITLFVQGGGPAEDASDISSTSISTILQDY